jgi:hypothetical protein
MNQGWRCADELQPGDLLRSHDGKWTPVDAVTDAGEVTTVYNVRIAEYHTYFVGSREWGWSVWAHNDCHHIVTKYSNAARKWTQNWARKSQAILARAGIGLNSIKNKVDLLLHHGPHPELYHQRVYERLAEVADGLRGAALTKAIEEELAKIAEELRADPSKLSGIGL